jgi:hypothetical protein
MRFPVTTGESAQFSMKLRVVGEGLCCYVNPWILKEYFQGDVDGDQLFCKIKEPLRRIPYDSTICLSVADSITEMSSDFSLSDIGYINKPKPYEIFEGMAAKELIGEVTNANYRSSIIAATFCKTADHRLDFINRCNRPDLLEKLLKNNDKETFIHLASKAVMDSFGPFYEGCFDARKDKSLLKYITMLLEGIRNPNETPIPWNELAKFTWKDKPVNLEPIRLVYNHCNKDLRGFVNRMPVVSVFFSGKGVTSSKKELVKNLLDNTNTKLSTRIISELNFDNLIAV